MGDDLAWGDDLFRDTGRHVEVLRRRLDMRQLTTSRRRTRFASAVDVLHMHGACVAMPSLFWQVLLYTRLVAFSRDSCSCS